MKIGMYSIRDQKFNFIEPRMFVNDQVAVRDFDQACHDTRTALGFKPADFDLFKVGIFDTENAQIEPIWPVEFIVNGASLV